MRARSGHGFTLVSALFLIVIVSLAGAFLVSLVGTEQRASSLGLLGIRADHAAQSGLEWAVARAVADPSGCPAGVLALTEAGLRGYSVTVTCSRSRHREGGDLVTRFAFEAHAERGALGDADYVSRRLRATANVRRGLPSW
jgi:MSHA biogenesis protein MshP